MFLRGKTPAALLCAALALGLVGCTADEWDSASPYPTVTVTVTETVTVEPSPTQSQRPTPTALPTPSATRTDAATPAPTATSTDSSLPHELTTFIGVIDGDTIDTEAGRVRIIGIDTPERGECGYQDAAGIIRSVLLPGDPVVLEFPPGQNATDRYDRLIRYVTTQSGEDIGTLQIESGNAVARYDSTDGYPRHPREDAYHSGQIAHFDQENKKVITTACR